MSWSAKNSVAIFSCQPLLLGTSVPNDMFGGVLKVIIGLGEMVEM